MTFTALVADIADRLNLRSDDALERIGRAVNRHNRRISASLGLNATRAIDTYESTTIDSADVVMTGVEKVYAVWTLNTGSRVNLEEITATQMRELPAPTAGTPTKYAVVVTASNYVIIRLNALPESVYDIYAHAMSVLADISGSDSPAFAQSFHDALAEAVIADEYRKQEKNKDADHAELISTRLISDLRMLQAKSSGLLVRSGQMPPRDLRGAGGGSGGGGSVDHSVGFTQTGLITFDRDPAAPFAVSSGSAKVPNLDADLLDGESGAFYTDADNLDAGTIPDARFPATLPAVSGVNLTALPVVLPASSGVNLTSLNASQLASGTIPAARFSGFSTPAYNGGNFTASGSMTWTVASGDISTYKYRIVGKSLLVQFYLFDTTVGGTPSTALRIAIPNSYVATGKTTRPITLVDNSANVTGYAFVDASGTYISVMRLDGGNFTAGTVWVFGDIEFEVN